MSPSDPPPVCRRAFLTGGVSVAAATLAGCTTTSPSDPSTTETLTPVVVRPPTTDGPKSPGQESTPTDDPTQAHYRRVEVHLTETDPETIATAVLRGDRHLEAFEGELLDRVISEGSSTFTSINYDVLSERLYVARSAGYFRITRSVVATESVTAHAFQLDAITPCPGRTQPTPTGEDPIPSKELPQMDQQVFLRGVRDHYETDACFSFSDRLVEYSSEARARSMFIGESPTLVRHRGDTYLVTFEGTETRPKRRFEFTAEKLGDTLEEYADAVVSEVAWRIEPQELPADQRTFFEELLAEGAYETENPIPDAVLDFLSEVKSNAYALAEFGPYFLVHDGAYYRLEYTDVMS